MAFEYHVLPKALFVQPMTFESFPCNLIQANYHFELFVGHAKDCSM